METNIKNLIIIGISETAQRIYTFVERYKLYNVIGFAADKQYIKESSYCGKPVYAIEDLPNHMDVKNDYIFVATLWNHLNADRRHLYERMKEYELYNFASIISPLASIRGRIGENCWVCDYVVTQEDSQIGDNVFIMDCAIIGHKTSVHNHTFVTIKATICGACDIGEQTYIGANSLIFDGTKIGEKCLIGAGTCVKRNVPPYTRIKILTETSQEIKTYSDKEIEEKWCSTKNIR